MTVGEIQQTMELSRRLRMASQTIKTSMWAPNTETLMEQAADRLDVLLAEVRAKA